jgi:hypothetical protein
VTRWALAVVASAAGAWVLAGLGPLNYDTAFNLVWGGQLADGEAPRLRLELAPTPKPLVLAAGTLVPAAGTLSDLVSLLALGWLGASAAAVAAAVAGRAAGILAAGLVLTREPVLSFGVRGYADIAYVALVLTAVAVAARGPGRPGPVVALLGLAGLLRPEAWLLTAAYLAVTSWRARRPPALALAALATAAPAVWCLTDLVLTGDPLWSLTGTRSTAALLERPTGLADALLVAPRRLGEIVREPLLLAAPVGVLVAWRRPEGRAVLAAGAVAFAAFVALAAAGLPAIGRYLLLVGGITVVLAAVGLVEAGRRGARSRRWAGLAVVLALALAFWAPAQADRLGRLRTTMAAQRTFVSDLEQLALRRRLDRCGPVAVPNHRLRPVLAARLGVPPEAVLAGGAPSGGGALVRPATARVARLVVLDRRDPAVPAERPPARLTSRAAPARWSAARRRPGARPAASCARGRTCPRASRRGPSGGPDSDPADRR